MFACLRKVFAVVLGEKRDIALAVFAEKAFILARFPVGITEQGIVAVALVVKIKIRMEPRKVQCALWAGPL